MKTVPIETIPFYDDISAHVCSDLKIGSVKNGLWTIMPNPEHNNYIIRTETGAVEFDFKNDQDKANLDNQFCRGSAHICAVKSSRNDGSFLFDLYAFAGSVEDFGDVEIYVENEKLSSLQNKNKPQEIEKLREYLVEDCTIKLDGSAYFIMQGNYEKTKKSESDEDDDNDEDNQNNVAELQGAFSIICERFGKFYAIKVEQKNLTTTGTDKYFTVTGVSPRKNIQPAGNFHLIKANLTFSNQKHAASTLNLEKLKAITEKSGSYLKAWKEYTGARGERVLKQARDFDCQYYNSCTPTSNDSVKLYFDINIAEKVASSKVEEVILCKNGDNLPIYLEDKKISFFDYCDKEFELEKERKSKEESKKKVICCQVLGCDDNCVEIKLPDMLSANDVNQTGYIVMSMTGEVSQIERQQNAWNAIAEAKAGINSLGNILEGSFDFMPSGNKPPKVHITNRVREKIFKKPPTDRQEEAINIALSTPEIALVQGPPGTGKTTVITAVLEILNEEQDKRDVIAGRVLATSYQHDAVENMIERIKVNSLPTWKYGKRRDAERNYNGHIDVWCNEIKGRVFSLHPNICISHEEETFQTYVSDYVYSPLPENKQRLLEYILNRLPVTEDHVKRARTLNNRKIASCDYDADLTLLRKIRALRTTDESFADDGKKRAEELYFTLDDRKWFDEHKDAENLLMNPTEDQFAKLGLLKTELLEEFSPKPSYIVTEVEDDVVDLCEDVANFLAAQHGKKDKKEQIIKDWIEALQSGTEAFSRAIKDCDFVYSATSQQSEGKDITKQKKEMEGEKSYYTKLYDTVIIDEAARATPPDLLIPMCKAVKRIILVGDHRQLPQLVDDELCSNVYENVKTALKSTKSDEISNDTEDIEEIYEKSFNLSLFELLFKKLKTLEKKDGIKRTITLDKQFRTHPVLGKFCSRMFYEPYGEGYESPRPASDFEHCLPGIENKAAVWIDVQKDCGKEEKRGTSRIRECEVDCIIERFLSFVQSQKDIPREKKMSYGIIAFYSEQRNLIIEKIKKHPAYKTELKDVSYKVGTVDAFQGMEFDVVFLSIVRTSGDIYFLTPNRLCVSMSRQKKVLIAVGCKEFVTSEKARQQKIPALSEFYDLCAGKNDEGYGAVMTWKK